MRLHENPELFEETIDLAVNELGIPPEFVEKDYWICHILQNLSRLGKEHLCVWKGGTSIAKAYKLVNRFSSDVDIAILTDLLSQNQQKKLVTQIGHASTVGLTETEDAGTIKNNKFRKTYHSYNSVIKQKDPKLDFLGNYVIVEINTYGNPYPYERRRVSSFITEILQSRDLSELIKEYDMGEFELNVLDKRRTMVEKIVSLLRFSFTPPEYKELKEKIRHFYDLYFMCQDKECSEYMDAEFPEHLLELIVHDRHEYDRPPQWKNSDILSSVLFTDFDGMWKILEQQYISVLDSLCYGDLPKPIEIASANKALMERVRKIIEGDNRTLINP